MVLIQPGHCHVLYSSTNMPGIACLLHTTVYYVNSAAVGGNNGTSWSDAFTKLQGALDVAVAGDCIWIAQGVYKPTKDHLGNAAPADSRDKNLFMWMKILPFTEDLSDLKTDLSQRNPTLNPTVFIRRYWYCAR